MDPVLEDQIKMGPAILRKSVKPRAEQILELAPPDMVSVVHVSRVGFGSLGSGLSDPKQPDFRVRVGFRKFSGFCTL